MINVDRITDPEGNRQREAVYNLLAVIKDVHSQQGDDLCWMDIDRIFKATGLEVPDRSVGNKVLMLSNCALFIETMCKGGKWLSYQELLAENARLRTKVESLEQEIVALQEMYNPPREG